jgi:hypothetical protein
VVFTRTTSAQSPSKVRMSTTVTALQQHGGRTINAL